jgi:methylmalonyl-CoA/ethylmalonyl-CoA epimerase
MTDLAAALSEVLIGIDHVGIAVRDLDAAIARWTNNFGFTLAHQEINEEQGVHEAMLAVGDGTYLQLLAPLNSESTIAKFLERSGEGMQQLAFTVTDVRAAMSLIEQTGMRLLYPEPRRGTGGSQINFVHPKDTGGVLVELVEHVSAH